MWAGWVHHSWRFEHAEALREVGPETMNADQKRQRCQSSEQNLEFFRPDPNDFLSRLVTMDETWLFHYDPETKQQWMELRHCGHPAPKNSKCKNPLEKFSLRFFGIKTASSSLIIFQRAKLSTRSITHLCWCNWRTFWKKNAAGRHLVCFVLAWQFPGSPGTCNPEETGLPGLPMSSSPTLFSGSGRVGLPPVPWTEKNNWTFVIFRPTRRLLMPRRPG